MWKIGGLDGTVWSMKRRKESDMDQDGNRVNRALNELFWPGCRMSKQRVSYWIISLHLAQGNDYAYLHAVS